MNSVLRADSRKAINLKVDEYKKANTRIRLAPIRENPSTEEEDSPIRNKDNKTMENNPKRYKLWLDSDEADIPRTTLYDRNQRDLEIVLINDGEPIVLDNDDGNDDDGNDDDGNDDDGNDDDNDNDVDHHSTQNEVI
ncbi:ciliogenesis-associated TTC17-interacting protein-like [Leptopilina boulardi]|uniref:ciliogenesis-associated TTC17-interacting protein-like n=1 Tax=Leptopilina boulardi TaxID=63433 RepID=UPI0021F5750E|nr:ciliogenesis-associated TTC17-interacting protein-like [Leptopilina boulardi]